jgi:hypothetical protein
MKYIKLFINLDWFIKTINENDLKPNINKMSGDLISNKTIFYKL